MCKLRQTYLLDELAEIYEQLEDDDVDAARSRVDLLISEITAGHEL